MTTRRTPARALAFRTRSVPSTAGSMSSASSRGGFAGMDHWVDLNLVETRTFPGGIVLTRYETKR